MQDLSLGMLLMLALAWGIRHAFDADHVLTVSGLGPSFSPSSTRRPLRFIAFCLHWSLGHGGIILIIGCLVLLLGMSIPFQLSQYADLACAALLVCLGLGLMIGSGLGSKAKSESAPRLTRWSTLGFQLLRRNPNQSALSIGVLHGLSGSAPLLALLPLTQMQSAWTGILYLLVFGIGVSLGMTLFAACLSVGARRLKLTAAGFQRFRLALGACSVIYGFVLLAGTL